MSIGKNIRDIRKSKNMSQSELGKLLGVSQAMIAQYENGTRMPKIETIARIAEALNVYIGRLDESWGVDIINNPEEYEKFRIKIAAFESTLREETSLLSSLSPGETISTVNIQENKLLSDFRILNAEGQMEAIKRIEELTEIKKYTED